MLAKCSAHVNKVKAHMHRQIVISQSQAGLKPWGLSGFPSQRSVREDVSDIVVAVIFT